MSNIDFLMKQLEKKMEAGELETQEWKLNLIKDNNGKILNCIDNYILYFTSSSKYKGKLKYNEFLQRKEFKGEEFTDFDEARACNDIEHELGLSNITKTIPAPPILKSILKSSILFSPPFYIIFITPFFPPDI